MLQRSPTYVVSRPAKDPVANRLDARLPGSAGLRPDPLEERAAQHVLLQRCPQRPERVQEGHPRLRAMRQLAPDYDVDTHFTPALQPVGPAAVPGARRRPVRAPSARGKATVVTDTSTASPRRASGCSPARELAGRHHRHRHRAEAARSSAASRSPSTGNRSTSPRRWPTRA